MPYREIITRSPTTIHEKGAGMWDSDADFRLPNVQLERVAQKNGLRPRIPGPHRPQQSHFRIPPLNRHNADG